MSDEVAAESNEKTSEAEKPLRLWSLFEAVAHYALIVLAFAFTLGGRNYAFAIELFAPVLLIGVVGAALQMLVSVSWAWLWTARRPAQRALRPVDLADGPEMQPA